MRRANPAFLARAGRKGGLKVKDDDVRSQFGGNFLGFIDGPRIDINYQTSGSDDRFDTPTKPLAFVATYDDDANPSIGR